MTDPALTAARHEADSRGQYLRLGVGLLLTATAILKLLNWHGFLASLAPIEGSSRLVIGWLLVIGEFAMGGMLLLTDGQGPWGKGLFAYAGLLTGGRLALPSTATCLCLGFETSSMAAWGVLLVPAGAAVVIQLRRSWRHAARGAMVGVLFALVGGGVANRLESTPVWQLDGVVGRTPGRYTVRLASSECVPTDVASSCSCLTASLTHDGIEVNVVETIPPSVVPNLVVSYRCTGGTVGTAEAVVPLE